MESFADFNLCISSLHWPKPCWFTIEPGLVQGCPLLSLPLQIFFDVLINELQYCVDGVNIYDMFVKWTMYMYINDQCTCILNDYAVINYD